MKKKLLSLIVIMTLVSSLSGCKSSKATDSSSAGGELPFKKITLVMFGDESSRMSELMKNEFKDTFKKEINTEVELQYIPWGEYGAGKKIDLMIAAGENFDGARTHDAWCAASVSKKYLADLTDVSNKYLPDLKKSVTKEAFDSFTYGGKLYAIPIGNKPSAGQYTSICVRQDILQALGMNEIKTLDDVDKFVTAAKAKYPDMYATSDIGLPAYLLRGASDRNLVTTEYTGLVFDEDAGKFVSLIDAPEFKTVCNLENKWYKNNLIPKDALTNRSGNTALFEAGNFLFFRGTSGTTVLENLPKLQKVVPTAQTKEYFLNPSKPKYKSMYSDFAFQVPAYSKNADRVAMIANLLQKNTDYVDMFTYGIKDKDYKIVDNKIQTINKDELFYQWATFNTKISTFDEKFPTDFIPTYKSWDDGAVKSKLVGFALNLEPIKSEKAKIDAVWSEFGEPMTVGFTPYDENIDKLKTALKNAGWDKYVAEIQKQMDEFNAKNK